MQKGVNRGGVNRGEKESLTLAGILETGELEGSPPARPGMEGRL